MFLSEEIGLGFVLPLITLIRLLHHNLRLADDHNSLLLDDRDLSLLRDPAEADQAAQGEEARDIWTSLSQGNAQR